MSMLKWSKEFELGIPVIDEQHKKFLEIINDFYTELNNKNIGSKFNTLLQEVADYTKYHFKEEERFMKDFGFSGYRGHADKHRMMIDKIDGYIQKLNAGENVLSIIVTSDVKNWVKEHILIEDKKYAREYLRG